MSLGYLGKCKKICEDEESVLYVYSGENWNDENSHSGDADLYDGEIVIQKRCLEEPEIHKKIVRTPSHKKKVVVKRIPHFVYVQDYINSGDILIKRCKNEFHPDQQADRDYIATHILYHIFEEYQISGTLPDSTAFIQ